MTSRQLHGTVAVVTGGASGIGYSLAKAYGLRGASVVIIDRDRQGLNRALTNLARAGVDATGHAIDLCDAAAVDAIASEVESTGPLSALCLNAGVNGGGANVWETPQSAFDFVFGVNVWSLVNSIRSLVPLLIDHDGRADLVITASLAGLLSLPRCSTYLASKAAAVALARSLRVELASVAPQVRVACLAPAMVKTNLFRTTAAQEPAAVRKSDESIAESEATQSVLGASPDDVARWVLDAVDAGRFWVLSDGDDPFVRQLRNELDELMSAAGGVR